MKKWLVIFAIAAGIADISLIVWPPAQSAGDGENISLLQDELNAPMEEVPYGCMTYGINESSLKNISGITNVRFSQLAGWKEDELCKFPPAPDNIAALHEKRVYIVGFMYPLEPGKKIGSFKLMRSTQTCCWGPAPEYNQFILVTTPGKKVKFERIKPVAVVGKFFVECNPRSGYIFRMEGEIVVPAVKEEGTKPFDFTALEKEGYIKLDYSIIEKLKSQLEEGDGVIKEWPPELLALEGKKVFADGYIAVRIPPPFGSQKEKLVVSKYPNAEDARLSNSVFVRFSEDARIPPMWASRTAIKGKLLIHKRPATWRNSGIVMLDQANQVGSE